MNTFNTLHKYRKVDSPLPAVPLPAKFVTLNRNAKTLRSKVFQSCEDLSKKSQVPKKTLGYISASQPPQQSVNNTDQPKFNMACKFTVQEDPLLSYGKSMFSDETLKPATAIRNHSHDYEELTDQTGTQVPNSSHQHGNSKHSTLLRPQATGGSGKESSSHYQLNSNEKSPTTISTVATSRVRENPMYAGYDPPKRSASQSTSDDSDSDKALYGRAMSRKQRTKILLMCIIVITTCISIAALTTTTLFAFGILSPQHAYENQESSHLKENIEELAIKTVKLSNELHGKLQQVDRRMVDQNKTVDDLLITVKNLSESSNRDGLEHNKPHNNNETTEDVRNTSEYQNLITEYENLLISLRDKSSNCRHETFSIGSSSSQEFTESGEYYADESYVITGVTCSSTNGYISTLRSRMDNGKTKYKCVCHRSEENIVGMFGNRVECRIHYWQCPN